MFVSGWKWKTRKIIIPSPVPSYELLVSVKRNTDRKREKTIKKERKKYGLNTNQTERSHVMYNAKILPQ